MSPEPRDDALDEALRRLEREVAEPLAAWSKAEQADVDAAIEEASAAERAAAVRAIQGLARPAKRPFGGLSLAAALAASIALGFLVRGQLGGADGDTRPERTPLGPGHAVALEPGPLVERYDRFAWSSSGKAGMRYGLRVWNAGELEPALEVDGLTRPAYEPRPEELLRLGPAIRWEVVLQDADNRALSTLLSSSSSRSP
jgi:hypothetical protein